MIDDVDVDVKLNLILDFKCDSIFYYILLQEIELFSLWEKCIGCDDVNFLAYRILKSQKVIIVQS